MPVLLLRTNHNIFHHGTLGAIRSLGRAGVEVHAVMERRTTPAARSRHLHRRLGWAPDPGSGRLLDYLTAAAGRIGRRALLVTMDDAGALFIADNVGPLSESFAFPVQRPDALTALADKAGLADTCRRFGIAHPDTRCPRSRAEADQAVTELGLPLVAKWARPWQLPAGLRPGTAVVGTRAEARRLFAACRPETTGPLLLQQRVAPVGTDWFFQGYFDVRADCLMGGTGQKLLSAPPRAGATVLGRWLPNPEVEKAATHLLSQLGYSGPVDMDFRIDEVTGSCYLLDVNVRLGAQFRLFTDRQGLDLVRAMHLDLSGRAVPPAEPHYGRSFLAENHYARRSVRRAEPEDPGEDSGRVLRALRRADELAWYSLDDPAPFLAMGAHSVAWAGRRAGRRAVRWLTPGRGGGRHALAK